MRNIGKSQAAMAQVIALLLVKPRHITDLARITGSHPDTIRNFTDALEEELLVAIDRFPGGRVKGKNGRPSALVTWINHAKSASPEGRERPDQHGLDGAPLAGREQAAEQVAGLEA